MTPTCLPMAPYLRLDNNPLIRRGKTPPIDEFTAEDRCVTLDDCLLILECAATWNR